MNHCNRFITLSLHESDPVGMDLCHSIIIVIEKHLSLLTICMYRSNYRVDIKLKDELGIGKFQKTSELDEKLIFTCFSNLSVLLYSFFTDHGPLSELSSSSKSP